MLRDNLVELIEPMLNSAGADPLALRIHNLANASDDRLPCLENPRPEGAEPSLTENAASPVHAEPRHSVVTGTKIDLKTPTNLQITRDIFAAKEVPLILISRMPEHREFHKQDWPAVEVTTSGKLEQFDFYFDFVIDQTKLLEALWKE